MLTIDDFKELFEIDYYNLEGDIIGMLKFLILNNNKEREIFIQSFSRLPDELHYGFHILFTNKSNKKSYLAFMEKVDKYFMREHEEYEKKKQKYALIEIPCMRAIYLLKLFNAFVDMESANFEDAFEKIKNLYLLDVKGDFKIGGKLGFLYLVQRLYNKFEDFDENCKCRDTLLDYLLAIYTFAGLDKPEISKELLRTAVIGNPLVVNVLSLSLLDKDLELDFNFESIAEAQAISVFLLMLFNSEYTTPWVIKNATEILEEIRQDPILMEKIEHHLMNDDDGDTDFDENYNYNDNDGKVIKLYKK